MKIGILTTHRAINYGAVLQAYALSEVIKDFGFYSEIIDYCPKTKVYGRMRSRRIKGIKDILINLYMFFNIKNQIIQKQKIKRFDEFVNQNFNLSFYKFSKDSDFSKLDKYDVFIVGSDQVWNLNLMDLKPFFLPFQNINSNSVFIAYAPSISENLTNEQMSIIENRTKHFNYISCREKKTASILKEKLNREVVDVIDPVFLLDKDKWINKFPPIKNQGKYIFVYFLGVSDLTALVVAQLKRITGYKVVSFTYDIKQKLEVDYQFWGSNPSDFVSYISGAEIVCSNSFHATAFSILFNKKHIIVEHETRNLRMDNINEIFMSTNTTIKSISDIEKIEYMLHNQTINYDSTYIDASKDFLKKAIFNVKRY